MIPLLMRMAWVKIVSKCASRTLVTREKRKIEVGGKQLPLPLTSCSVLVCLIGSHRHTCIAELQFVLKMVILLCSCMERYELYIGRWTAVESADDDVVVGIRSVSVCLQICLVAVVEILVVDLRKYGPVELIEHLLLLNRCTG